ncbi:MAG: DUF3540 domain-containing protein [Planctomycetes bacterium]|nr:DUF3540 domain-containing protein [Planctomycetota bacterium]
MIELKNNTINTATITGVSGAEILALNDSGEIVLTNALAHSYRPNVKDTVLVVSSENASYIIGVVNTSADAVFTFPANVQFHAPKGEISFSSGKKIDLHAPEIKLTGGKIKLLAKSLTEKVETAFRSVKGLLRISAGQRQSKIEGVDLNKAEQHVMKASKDVKIDGQKINLG